jgi:hypothetical protein
MTAGSIAQNRCELIVESAVYVDNGDMTRSNNEVISRIDCSGFPAVRRCN